MIIDAIYYIKLLASYLGGEIFKVIVQFDPRIDIARSSKFRGFSNFELAKNSKLKIGEHCLLNSCNTGYHANLTKRIKVRTHSLSVINIGNHCRLHGLVIHARSRIDIGDRCVIASGVVIMDHNGHVTSMDTPHLRLTKSDEGRPISIGNDVWIGLNSIILPGTEIGDGSVVPAGSVVRGKVDPHTIYGRTV